MAADSPINITFEVKFKPSDHFFLSDLVWLDRIILPCPVLSFGINIYPGVFVNIFWVINLDQIAPGSQTLKQRSASLQSEHNITWKTNELSSLRNDLLLPPSIVTVVTLCQSGGGFSGGIILPSIL